MARARSVRKMAALIVVIEFLLEAQVQGVAIAHDLVSVVIYHPLSTLTEAEIEVRAVQSLGQRVLIWRRRSL